MLYSASPAIGNAVACSRPLRLFSSILALSFLLGCGSGKAPVASTPPVPSPAPAPSPAPTPSTTKAPIHGLVSMGSLAFSGKPGTLPDNSMEEINAHPAIYSGAVINLLWSQLEPQQGTFDDSALNDALATIALYNAKYPGTPVAAKLRINVGVGTPAWVMQLTGGPITISGTNGTFPIAAYWSPAWKSAWQALQVHLAGEYDTTSTIAEVAISSCSSVSDEPFITSLDSTSLPNMRQFGYSDTADMNCLLGASEDYSAWSHTPLDFTFNTFRSSDACTTANTTNCITEVPTFTVQVMDAFRAALTSSRAVVANHGLQNPLAPAAVPVYAEFQNLYNEAQAQTPPSNSPLEFQSYSPAVNWDSAIQLGLTYHPTEIEIWNTTAAGGPANLTAAQLQSYAAELQ